MSCRCGATSCFVCRQEITASEGYTHFCQHFRAVCLLSLPFFLAFELKLIFGVDSHGRLVRFLLLSSSTTRLTADPLLRLEQSANVPSAPSVTCGRTSMMIKQPRRLLKPVSSSAVDLILRLLAHTTPSYSSGSLGRGAT